jgi:hypothetical protein
VSVHEARSDILSGSVDYLGFIAYAVRRVTDQSDAALGYRYVDAFLDLAGADIDQLRVFDDRVGLLDAHGDIRHSERNFIERFLTEFVKHKDHLVFPFSYS